MCRPGPDRGLAPVAVDVDAPAAADLVARPDPGGARVGRTLVVAAVPDPAPVPVPVAADPEESRARGVAHGLVERRGRLRIDDDLAGFGIDGGAGRRRGRRIDNRCRAYDAA